MRDRVRDSLFAWPPRFRFPGALDFQSPELSRLAFVVRYESYLGALESREARTLPWVERVREGVSVPVKKLAGDRWKVLSELDSSLLSDSGGHLDHLLVPEGDEGEQAQMSYDDYRNRKAFCPGFFE